MNDVRKVIEFEKRLYEYEGDDRIISSYDLQESYRYEDNSIKIMSRIPTLDKLIESFEGGELSVISGLTGHGKTLFCQTLTNNFAEQDVNSLWFSYEVRADNFLKSFGLNLPLFYMPVTLKESSIKWLSTRIHEAKVKYQIQAVFVDHLHFLVDMSRHHISVEIGATMRAIKKLALQYNVCFFLIAHTTKIKPDTELTLGDTRDSSFIEQEADNVFYIWRATKGENEGVLKIAKNRRHGVFEKKVRLIKSGNFLGELTP